MIDTARLVADAGNVNSPVLIVKDEYDGQFLFDPYGSVLVTEFARCGKQAATFHLTHLWRYRCPISPEELIEHRQLLWNTMRTKSFVLFLGKAAEPFVEGSYEGYYGLPIKSLYIPDNVLVAMGAPSIKFASYSHGEMRLSIEKFCSYIGESNE